MQKTDLTVAMTAVAAIIAIVLMTSGIPFGNDNIAGSAIDPNDAVPPIAKIVSPISGSTVNGIITLDIRGKDLDGNAIVKVEWYLNGVYQWSVNSHTLQSGWDTKSLKEGQHTIEGRVYNSLGLMGSASSTFTVDNIPSVCGNSMCEAGEDSSTCATDCRVACTDSDGGINYYVKGTNYGYYNAYNPTMTSTDSCMTLPSASGSNVYSGPHIVEGYCNNNQITEIFYTCPNGCVDGACLNQTNLSGTPLIIVGANAPVSSINLATEIGKVMDALYGPFPNGLIMLDRDATYSPNSKYVVIGTSQENTFVQYLESIYGPSNTVNYHLFGSNALQFVSSQPSYTSQLEALLGPPTNNIIPDCNANEVQQLLLPGQTTTLIVNGFEYEITNLGWYDELSQTRMFTINGQLQPVNVFGQPLMVVQYGNTGLIDIRTTYSRTDKAQICVSPATGMFSTYKGVTCPYWTGIGGDSLVEGETKTYSINSQSFEVTSLISGKSSAKYLINGVATHTLTLGDTAGISGAKISPVYFAVKDSDEVTGVSMFCLGLDGPEAIVNIGDAFELSNPGKGNPNLKYLSNDKTENSVTFEILNQPTKQILTAYYAIGNNGNGIGTILAMGNGYQFEIQIGGPASGRLTINNAVVLNLTDTTPPTINITSPTNGQTVSGTIIIGTSASDDVGIKLIIRSVDGVPICTWAGIGSTECYWDTTQYTNGLHNIHGYVEDLVGNSAGTSLIFVIVNNTINDTTPPNIFDVYTQSDSPTSQFVSFTVDESSYVHVRYGTTTNYQFRTDDTTLAGGGWIGLYNLIPDTTYHYSVTAVDQAGNRANTIDSTFRTAADTTPPVITPINKYNLSAGTTQTQMTVLTNENAACRWNYAPTVGYQFMTPFATTGLTNHSTIITGLQGGYNYRYVKCQDQAGNTNPTDTIVVLHVIDLTPPMANITTPLTNQQFPAGTNSISLDVVTNEYATCRWSTSNQAYSNMPSTNTLSGSLTTYHSATLSGLQNGQNYTRHVRCIDLSGNAMTNSVTTFFSVANTQDNTPPSAVSNFRVTGTTSSSVSMAWNAATDNVGVANYRVTRDGVQVWQGTTLSLTDINLQASRTYSYTIEARDAAGNAGPINSLSATTACVDTSWSPNPNGCGTFTQTSNCGNTRTVQGNVICQTGWTCTNNQCVAPASTACDSPAVGAFRACYYDNKDFTNLKINRVDNSINYNWGSGSPSTTIAKNTFSATWLGEFAVTPGRTYTFTAASDDGIRVYVNGNLVINDWSDHSARIRTGKYTVPVGTSTAIVNVQYYENSGSASAKVSWT